MDEKVLLMQKNISCGETEILYTKKKMEHPKDFGEFEKERMERDSVE